MKPIQPNETKELEEFFGTRGNGDERCVERARACVRHTKVPKSDWDN